MKRQEWPHEKLSGPDMDTETSLKEYGLAWIKTESETLFYYGVRHDGQDFDRFDFCSINNDTDVYNEYNWADWKSVQDFVGQPKDEWDTMPLTSKIQDLVHYYGYENIFGSSYWEGLTYEEVTEPK